MSTELKKTRLAPAQRREQLRDELWPDAGPVIWNRKKHDGFTTVPRMLPLVLTLMDFLTKRSKGKVSPARVYLELWARVYDEGLITIKDEHSHAYASGYVGTRAIRTWSERIWELEKQGFIRVKKQGNREICHILLVDPVMHAAKLYRDGKHKIPDEWWSAFVVRAQEVGADYGDKI